MRFPDSYVKVLMRVDFSDHHPILINLKEDNFDRYEKHFRFKNAWLTNDTYSDMLRDVWKEDNNVVHNLRNVVEGIDKWKFSNFDKVKRQKREIMKRLEGIQKNLQHYDNIGGMRRL